MLGGLGEIYFWPLSRPFFRPLGLLYYFYRKRQIYAISHSPELSIFYDLKSPMRLTGWAQSNGYFKPLLGPGGDFTSETAAT
jgi:hypothetical protein